MTIHDNVSVSEFARVNTGILAGDDPALDSTNPENELQMKREA